MSDLLSDVLEQSGLDGYGIAAQLTMEVREALRSDEIRAAIEVVLENTLCSCRRREESFFGGFCGKCEADAVVAFLAGGDDE